MRLLLDTSVVIWLLLRDERRIPASARDLLEAPEHAVLISAVSHWEIAIKRSLGKLDIEQDDWPRAIDRLAFTPLPLRATHAQAVERLPAIHADPFDRALVAQATVEALVIVTPDRKIGRYGVETSW